MPEQDEPGETSRRSPSDPSFEPLPPAGDPLPALPDWGVQRSSLDADPAWDPNKRIHDLWWKPVLQVTVALVPAQDRDDVQQEVWLRVLRYLDGGREIDNPRAFLVTVVKNLVAEIGRRKRPTAHLETAEELPAPGPPAELLELQAAVWSTVDKLPAELREALGRDLDGYTSVQVEKLFGILAATHRGRVMRAKQLFQEIWIRDFGQQGDAPPHLFG